MYMHTVQSRRRSGWISFTSLSAGTILVLILTGIVWMFTQIWRAPQEPQAQVHGQTGTWGIFDYTVTTEPGRIDVKGTSNLPNGVILVGTLDKIGAGPLDVKEALVMNRLFTLAYGPELRLQYPWIGPVAALTAGVYRLRVVFDPSRQSPLAREALLRHEHMSSPAQQHAGPREVDPAIVRIDKIIAIGTTDEQQQAQAREEQYRRSIRQHLRDTLGALDQLWQRLQSRYQQERTAGAFGGTDPRAEAWQTWKNQWLIDLKMLSEKSQLTAPVSPASPHAALRDTLKALDRDLPVLCDLYYEILTNERPLDDPELRRVEQQTRYALQDAIAQLGQPTLSSSAVHVANLTPTVIVTAPLVNIRSGPGMDRGVISHAKQDDVLELRSEQGEWFQVQLPDGRMGWVHRNVAKRTPNAINTAVEAQGREMKPVFAEQTMPVHLDPIPLSATPLRYIPRPTQDELNIYSELEPQLREVSSRNSEERQAAEQRLLRRMSERYNISPSQVWDAYLKVQGWEIER